VLGVNCHLIGNQVCRVETHTKLANHRDVSSGREGFHESFGSRLGNGTQVVNQISLGHADTTKEDTAQLNNCSNQKNLISQLTYH
jgi:hypothetical protein